ncbi:signal peptide peptidase-domain-containing protein [Trametes punicea]|nr:signal peptide peptidase-domain-containing protein [Trametes punicea]
MSVASTDWDLLSSYAGLLSLACMSIYAGSHGSLSVRPSHFSSRITRTPSVEAEEEEDEEEVERLSSQDAYLFPVIGSAVLFGLYLIVQYFGKEWITWLLQWYFTIAGVGSVGKSLIALSRWTLGTSRWHKFDKVQFLILKGRRGTSSPFSLSLSLRTPSLYLIPVGSIPSILYTFGDSATRRSALLTDLLALSFSHNALSLLKLDSFKTGCVLLSGLFLYDIWWVFGTEVMVKVATSLDVPIKLLWPKSLTFSTERGFTMLGLGDIVIPGMFVATALRYDYHKAAQQQLSQVSRVYFFTTLSAYASGLIVTMSIMHLWKKAQPALLYLSPACILSFILLAIARGEFKDAWAWTDEVDDKGEPKSLARSPSNGKVQEHNSSSSMGDDTARSTEASLSVEPEVVTASNTKKRLRKKHE